MEEFIIKIFYFLHFFNDETIPYNTLYAYYHTVMVITKVKVDSFYIVVQIYL